MSSSSSPAPCKSCTDVVGANVGASSAGVSALDDAPSVSPASLASALLVGTPNEKPGGFEEKAAGSFMSELASGVRGGLPKAKPTGLPIVPAEEPKVNAELLLVPKLGLVGVEGVGLSEPKLKPPPNALVGALSESFFSPLELSGPEKRLLENMEGAEDEEDVAEFSVG